MPIEEKLKYCADLENGGNIGYTPLGIRQISPGVFNNFEVLNIPKFIPDLERSQPEIVHAHHKEIEHFARQIHFEIVNRLLSLCAIVLDLPENYFLKSHRYEEKSNCHLRYMQYRPRSHEENAKSGETWFRGHTDFGSLTLLFYQPITALQVRSEADQKWKWVKPQPESIVVNLADTLEFVTNGFLKSSIHRVVAPPADQTGLSRLGVMYFVRPEDSMPMKPVKSAVLQKLGLEPSQGFGASYTAGEWVKARVANSNSGRVMSEQGHEDVLPGAKAKYYD